MDRRRLTSLLLCVLTAAALLAPATGAASVPNRVRAFPLAAHTHARANATESPWTRPASAADPVRIAAGCSVAAKAATEITAGFGRWAGLSRWRPTRRCVLGTVRPSTTERVPKCVPASANSLRLGPG